jgi:hypothetical protein
MDIVVERCAGLDVHKDTVVACVQVVLDAITTRQHTPSEQ